MNIAEVISQLSDAITASGKKVGEIGSQTIFDYLEKVGVPKQKWNEMYESLRRLHGESNRGTSGHSGQYESGPPKPAEKHREPRKSVFGQIKKIAG